MASYLVIGRTSAVTYQVLGQVKTISVLVFGAILFSKEFSINNGIGLFFSFLGATLYTKLSYDKKVNFI
jgi:solute carrier family 35, member E3